MIEQLQGVEGGTLLGLARAHLLECFGVVSRLRFELEGIKEMPRVNVTLRLCGSVRGSMSGYGSTLAEQVCDGVKRASLDTRFAGPIARAELSKISIEVWIQHDSVLVDVTNELELDSLISGLYGVDVEMGTSFAYYKPSVSLTSDFKVADELLSALSRKAGLPRDAWKNEGCVTRRTSWVHYAESIGGGVVELAALRDISKVSNWSADDIGRWLKDAAQYLVKNQNADGNICYKYNPITNEALKETANPVRAAGCAYALSAVATHLRRSEDVSQFVAAASLAIDVILARKTSDAEGRKFIRDTTKKDLPGGKLGTTALVLLAILQEAVCMPYRGHAEELLASIKSLQRQNGSLKCTFGDLVESSSQVNYFPGQALLACLSKAVSGDPTYRGVYEQSFEYYRQHFREYPRTAFIGWQADLWTRAAIADNDERYAAFVFEQVDWLLKLQILDRHQREYGAFASKSKPAGYSTIVYVEAVARAADLANRCGDVSRYRKYRESVHSGLAFCSLLRLSNAQSIFCPSPDRASGGMTTSLSSFIVRSDVVQHTATMTIALLERDHLL